MTFTGQTGGRPETYLFHAKQTVKLAMELKLASLGHIRLDGSKVKANTSKHKAMRYERRKEKEQILCAEIDDLIEKASRCDQEEDQAYRDKTGDEIPEDLQFKQHRLANDHGGCRHPEG